MIDDDDDEYEIGASDLGSDLDYDEKIPLKSAAMPQVKTSTMRASGLG